MNSPSEKVQQTTVQAPGNPPEVSNRATPLVLEWMEFHTEESVQRISTWDEISKVLPEFQSLEVSLHEYGYKEKT